MENNKKYQCPVCGYGLDFEPWDQNEEPADEMCPQCGIQFGYDDAAGGDTNKRQEIYKQWRERWEKKGKTWEPLN